MSDITIKDSSTASSEQPTLTRRRPKTRDKVSGISSLDMAIRAATLAEEKLGEDILLLDVDKITSYTSYILLISAKNSRQTASLSGYLEELFAQEFGVRPLSREGVESSGWMLLDFGDVVIHIFTTEERARYDLESFWPDAPRVDVAKAAKTTKVAKAAKDTKTSKAKATKVAKAAKDTKTTKVKATKVAKTAQ